MNKNVLIISTSLRKNGNSDTLATTFAQGASDAGNHVEKVELHGKTIQFCRGCLTCQRTGKCVIRDDVEPILRKMLVADVIVFATPIYYYEMCGQMKTILDRANPLYPMDYAFRDVWLLMTAADSAETAATGAIQGLNGWIACFGRTRLAGTVFAGGVTEPGDIQEHAALQKAYQAGKSIL